MGEDTKHLFDAEKKDRIITFVQKQLNKYRLAIRSTGVFILFLIVIMYNQCDQINFYKQNAKMNYLSIYQIEQKMTKEDRRKDATQTFMKVALHFQVNLDQRLLAEVANIVYDTGECIYGIPVEEWCVLFVTESEMKPTALNKKTGARGLGQLMPGIAILMAKELGIVYAGNNTLDNMRENCRMSMRWYWYLKSLYEKPKYYMMIYYWGETHGAKFYYQKKELSGPYKTYFYTDCARAKKRIEKIIGRKINIEGLNEE